MSECACTCDYERFGEKGNPNCPCWNHCACFDDSWRSVFTQGTQVKYPITREHSERSCRSDDGTTWTATHFKRLPQR